MCNQKDLVVLWTSGDKEVATKMVFMYTINSKLRNWWENITLIIWGPSSRLLSQDAELQDLVRKAMETGITVEACKACADQYGVSGDLEKIGVDVRYMGEPITNYIKEGRNLITI